MGWISLLLKNIILKGLSLSLSKSFGLGPEPPPTLRDGGVAFTNVAYGGDKSLSLRNSILDLAINTVGDRGGAFCTRSLLVRTCKSLAQNHTFL